MKAFSAFVFQGYIFFLLVVAWLTNLCGHHAEDTVCQMVQRLLLFYVGTETLGVSIHLFSCAWFNDTIEELVPPAIYLDEPTANNCSGLQ